MCDSKLAGLSTEGVSVLQGGEVDLVARPTNDLPVYPELINGG